nr:hypothetical protein RSP673_07055 [Ralstonia solanacearum P673]
MGFLLLLGRDNHDADRLTHRLSADERGCFKHVIGG